MPASEERARLVRLYRTLYLVRGAEEAVQRHYPEDGMKTPVHLSIGQESIAVGVCDTLRPDDRILATYRSHAVYLARTGDLDGFFAELYGRVTGVAHGKAGSMHLASPEHGLLATSAVVATTLPLALGAAFAARLRGSGARVVVFFGDGAVDEGVFWETLNFACLRGLPILFVCEDNGLAIHSRAEERHGYDAIARVVERFRCHVMASETTHPLEIAQLAAEGLRRMEASGQPAFLHLRCYRYVEHVGIAEDRSLDRPYRPEAEFRHWKGRDAVPLVRRDLLEGGLGEDALAEIERTIDARIAEAVQTAARAAHPPAADLERHVFA